MALPALRQDEARLQPGAGGRRRGTHRLRRKEMLLLHPDAHRSLSPGPGPCLPAEAATCGRSGEKRKPSPARGACAAGGRERPVSQRRPPGAPRARRTSGCRGASHRRLPPAVGGGCRAAGPGLSDAHRRPFGGRWRAAGSGRAPPEVAAMMPALSAPRRGCRSLYRLYVRCQAAPLRRACHGECLASPSVWERGVTPRWGWGSKKSEVRCR